ncbi:FabD/lysophospholipase-like protein [Ascobolus immersus RN42]|uniref:FabD/lysophospholipase-like protein n=1 Tax=Ascobolus immersus RN42 TaxID=1160509 RepID=A0A3N4I9Y8_ASCIM|nr:FabD/lysophospholipase-like protein [Ascobolus immersus RN42]
MEAEENTSRSGTHRSRSLIYGLSTNRSWSFDSIGEVGKELDLQDSGTEEMGAGNSTALGMEDSKVTDYEYVMADIYEKIQKQNLQQDDPVLRRLIEGQTKIRLTEENRPLRLLSLEYGGTRGLSMLFILQRLLHDIGKAEGRPAPKVCDYFDMITGSTSGGLIAIMLGTLEMEIEDCITAFDSFSEECFKYDRLDTDNADLYTQDTVHRAANQLLRFAGVSVHSSFIQPTDASSEKCKVLIYTTKIDGKPYYLRSYVPKHPGIDVDDVEAFPSLAPCNIRIVDAIQACLAVDVLSTRVWFPEMALHSFLKTSQLGPTCNATKYILAEAALQFPGRQIGSLVTLGTSPLKFALAESIYHLPILADTIATLANRLFRNAEALYSEALISTSPLPKCFSR